MVFFTAHPCCMFCRKYDNLNADSDELKAGNGVSDGIPKQNSLEPGFPNHPVWSTLQYRSWLDCSKRGLRRDGTSLNHQARKRKKCISQVAVFYVEAMMQQSTGAVGTYPKVPAFRMCITLTYANIRCNLSGEELGQRMC